MAVWLKNEWWKNDQKQTPTVISEDWVLSEIEGDIGVFLNFVYYT